MLMEGEQMERFCQDKYIGANDIVMFSQLRDGKKKLHEE